MAIKKPLKINEARVLVFLSQTDDNNKFAGSVAAKLDIDYGYTLHLMKAMAAKKWLKPESYPIKTYYFITKTAPLEEAKQLLVSR